MDDSVSEVLGLLRDNWPADVFVWDSEDGLAVRVHARPVVSKEPVPIPVSVREAVAGMTAAELAKRIFEEAGEPFSEGQFCPAAIERFEGRFRIQWSPSRPVFGGRGRVTLPMLLIRGIPLGTQ